MSAVPGLGADRGGFAGYPGGGPSYDECFDAAGGVRPAVTMVARAARLAEMPLRVADQTAGRLPGTGAPGASQRQQQ